MSEFDTSAGEDRSSFRESSDRDATEATDGRTSLKLKLSTAGLFLAMKLKYVQVLLDQVGSVEIELGTEDDDEADQVSESSRHVLWPHRRNNISKLAKLHTVGTTGYAQSGFVSLETLVVFLKRKKVKATRTLKEEVVVTGKIVTNVMPVVGEVEAGVRRKKWKLITLPNCYPHQMF